MAKTPDRSVIHKWALAAATTAGSLPVGLDAVALTGEEIAMVIHVASLFGHKISKKTARQALETGALGYTVGTGLFVAANVTYPVSIPVKIAIATGVMEALGNATYNFYANGGEL
ncbi:MAG: hypothetical protein IKN96_02720 [Oscillibacter sp.]|nr:hypothetical protein [Oscillibacter sp.]